jgi:Domain of unknown function (DUF4397)
MKNNRQHLIWSSIILVFVLAAFGCNKAGLSSSTTTPAVCYVSVMNEAPYSSACDIYFNGTIVSPSGGIEPEQFSSQYGAVVPGIYTVDFKVTGTDSVLYELPATEYDTSSFYTLILYNTASGSPAVGAARIVDNFSSVTTTSAYYRFFNLCPDMDSVDLYLNGTETQPDRTPWDFTNASNNAFQAVNPQEYSVQVKHSLSDSALASINAAAMAAGSVYTIFLEGSLKNGLALDVLAASY